MRRRPMLRTALPLLVALGLLAPATAAHADDAVVAGRVTDAVTGAPLPGVVVQWADPEAGTVAGAVVTGADGAYRLPTTTRKSLPYLAVGLAITSRRYSAVAAGRVGTFVGAGARTDLIHQRLAPYGDTGTESGVADVRLTAAGSVRLRTTGTGMKKGAVALTALDGSRVGRDAVLGHRRATFDALVPGRYALACRTARGWTPLGGTTVTVRAGAVTDATSSATCRAPKPVHLKQVKPRGATARVAGAVAFGVDPVSNLNLEVTRSGAAERTGSLVVSGGEVQDGVDAGAWWAAGTYRVRVWNDDRAIAATSPVWSTGVALPTGSPYWFDLPEAARTIHLVQGRTLDLGAVPLVLRG